ncbi:MAG: c-type cytochrome [Dokdonella sp.]
MSFRHVVVLTALFAAGPALAQSPPAQTPPTEAPVKPEAPAADAPAANALLLGDAKTGETKAATCGACHGVDGNPSDKQYPKLAGQNEAYISRQLALFKTQKRQNAIMLGFASALSPQDMHDVGAYFASKTSLPGVADDKLLERGQALYRGGDAKLGIPACMACHGPDGRGMAGTGFPQLGGQWADYVTAKLKDWKGGTSWGDDAKAKVMPAIAQSLSEADINALASYVEGLHTANAGTTTAAQ